MKFVYCFYEVNQQQTSPYFFFLIKYIINSIMPKLFANLLIIF